MSHEQIKLKLQFTSRISKTGNKLYITIPRSIRPLLTNRDKLYLITIEEHVEPS